MNEQETKKLVEETVRKEIAVFSRQNKYQFDRPVGFFNTEPKPQALNTTSDTQVLVDFGLRADGNKKVNYEGSVQAVVNDSSDYTVPTGWSVVQTGSTGVYTITHNLGSTDYKIFAMSTNGNPRIVGVTKSSNTVVVSFEDDNG